MNWYGHFSLVLAEASTPALGRVDSVRVITEFRSLFALLAAVMLFTTVDPRDTVVDGSSRETVLLSLSRSGCKVEFARSIVWRFVSAAKFESLSVVSDTCDASSASLSPS